eukprot:Skav232185  [mRNA]  locus=scaffold4523:36862:39766:- [translate_table: standard]
MAISPLRSLCSWRTAVKIAPQIRLCQRAASNSRKMKPNKPVPDFPAGLSEWESFMPHGESKEILFEDVFEAGDGEETFNWGQDEPEPSSAEPAVETKPPPLKDHDLPDANLLTLAKDEFVWAVGRAATLKLSSDSRVWKDLPHAIHAFGGLSEFTPSEVCRLVQALAYAPADAPVDKKLLQRLFKIFALRAKEFSDERLMRMMYAYGKLSSKRGLCLPRFMDFATSEVVEREVGLPSWRKVRILESVGSLPEAGREFKTLSLGTTSLVRLGDQGRASKNLEALKLVDFVLRHERSSSLEVLTPQGLQLLAKARDTPLQPPDDHATCSTCMKSFNKCQFFGICRKPRERDGKSIFAGISVT